jgi:hypothetical protein
LLTKRKRTSGNNLVQKRTTEIASSSVGGGDAGTKRIFVNQRADPREENKENKQVNSRSQSRELIID